RERRVVALSERNVRIKRLLDDLRVTAAQVCVTAAKLNYYCSKIKTAERVSTVRERIKTEERIKILMLLVYKLLLLVLKVNAASTKVSTAQRLRLLKEFLLSEKE
ncbi:hypothetical protein Tco_0448402, partial [Tanacetum coccineum]